MAKTVKPFELRLKVLGDEAVKKLGSSFRDLDKALNISNNEIKKLRKEVLGYNKEGQQSEQLIKGQITALKALQGQVEVNGRLYQKLGNNVADLKAKLLGTTASVQAQREAILKNVNAQKLSSATAGKYVAQLKKLQNQTVKNSQASKEFEQDIASLTQKMRELKRQELGQLGKGTVEFSKGATTNLGRLINRLGDLGRASKTALGAWTRTVEGIGALGVVGAGAKGITGAGLMATGAAQGATGGLANYLASAKEALSNLPVLGDRLSGLVPDAAISKVAELTSSIAQLDSQLDVVNQSASAITSTLGQFGPEAAAAGIAAGSGIAIFFDLIKRRSDKAKAELNSVIQSIDDKVQRTLQSLARLEDQMSGSKIAGLLGQARAGFAATPAGSYRSRSMASQIAGLEALAVQEAAAQADVLEHYRKRVRGTREDAQALGDRLAYVQGKLKTLDQTTEEGRAEFAQYSNEAISLTDKLNKLADGYRHVSTMATQAATAQENAVNAATRLNYLNFGAAQAQRQAMAELGQRVRAGVAGTPLALPAAGQTSAPGTGAAISGGARQFRGQVETTFDDPNFRVARTIGIGAGYFNPATADVGQPAAVGRSVAEQGQAARKTGADLLQYTAAISKARQANTGSINSIDNLRQALINKRNVIPATSAGFRRLTKEIEALDRQSAKYALNQRKRGGLGRNVRAGVGSALSGAVFGGPEAAVGGLIGGLTGGIAGGAAGAGLGAQASMLRQSLAGAAEYAAQLEKMRIALKGVAGPQSEYSRALSIADRVTSRFNVAQGDSITGMTRLTAAVTGAGGKVYDAGLVFENVTAAIKATGGSTEDVNSAITAMVQVFSKGKVSAEELSGQLGERLPGAVTLFAEANKMSLVELQKALKAGTVGLDELMKFVIELGNKYGDTADKISGSGAEAGARLKVIVDELRAELGKALQPVGEELQNTFADFLKTNRQAIIQFTRELSKNLLDLIKVLKEAAPLLKQLGRALLIAGTVAAVTKGFGLLTAALGRFNVKSAVTLVRAGKLNTAVKRLRLSAAKPIVFTIALIGLDAIIQASNEIKRLRREAGQRVQEEKDFDAKTYIQGLGGSAQTKDVFERQLAEVQTTATKANRTLTQANEQVKKFESWKVFGETGETLTGTIFNVLTGIEAAEQNARAQAKGASAVVDKTYKQQAALLKQIPLAKQPTPSDYADPTGGGDEDGGSKGKGKVLMTQQELLLRRQIREAVLKENDLAKAVATYRLDVLEASKETEDSVAKQNMLEEAKLKLQQSLLEYKAKQVEKEKELKRITSDITYDFKQRQYQLGLISKEQLVQSEVAREEANLREQTKDMDPAKAKAIIDQGKELKRRELDPTFKEAAETDLVLMERQLEAMLDPLNQLKGAAEAFGSSLTNAFNSVITGQASVKAALAGFLKDLGQYFLEYTAKVITQMIVIATVQAAIKALGGPSLSGGGGMDLSGTETFNVPVDQMPTGMQFAQGGILDKGLKRYAMGGVVNKPTMFTYAEGGTGRFGLMGEAGPEAIIPLKRGNDGRLGVSAYFADANAAMAKGAANRSSSAAFDENAEALALGNSYSRERVMERERQTMLTGAGGSMLIQTQVINNVEYATMDQVAQATAASAKQARAQVFADMRNKPSTRSSLGMR